MEINIAVKMMSKIQRETISGSGSTRTKRAPAEKSSARMAAISQVGMERRPGAGLLVVGGPANMWQNPRGGSRGAGELYGI